MMKPSTYICMLAAAAFLESASAGSPLLYPSSWYVETERGRFDTVVLHSPDSLSQISVYYIETLVRQGWRRIADLSWLNEPGAGSEWGGIFEKDSHVIKLRCWGVWNVGVLSKDGEVPRDGQRFLVQIIRIRVLAGGISDLLGEDYSRKSMSSDELASHLKEQARRFPHGQALFDAGIVHIDNDPMLKLMKEREMHEILGIPRERDNFELWGIRGLRGQIIGADAQGDGPQGNSRQDTSPP